MGKKIAEQVYALPFHYRDHLINTEMEMHMDMRKFLCLINRCINTNAVKLAASTSLIVSVINPPAKEGGILLNILIITIIFNALFHYYIYIFYRACTFLLP